MFLRLDSRNCKIRYYYCYVLWIIWWTTLMMNVIVFVLRIFFPRKSCFYWQLVFICASVVPRTYSQLLHSRYLYLVNDASADTDYRLLILYPDCGYYRHNCNYININYKKNKHYHYWCKISCISKTILDTVVHRCHHTTRNE